MPDLAITAVTSTSVELAIDDVTGGAVQLQVQYSPREDFHWSPAPMPRFEVADSITLEGLNQAGTYFFRVRELAADTTPGPWSLIVSAYTPLATPRDTSLTGVVIEPTRLVVPERVQQWYCASEETGYPARSLGRDDPSCALWCRRAIGIYAFEATIAGAPIDTIALLETNASEDAMITVKADTTTAGVRSLAPAFTTGALPFRASPNMPQRPGYHALVRLVAAQAYPIWRVEVTGDVPGELLAATYAVFGRARVTKNMSANKNETPTDSSTMTRGRNGTPSRAGGMRGRSVDIDLSLMTIAQFETEYADLRWRVGTTDPVLLVPNSKPGAYLHDQVLYGALNSVRATQPYTARMNQSFSIESLI